MSYKLYKEKYDFNKKPTNTELKLNSNTFINRMKDKYDFKFNKKKIIVGYQPTTKERLMLLEIANYFSHHYGDSIYNMKNNTCDNDYIGILKIILYNIDKPQYIDDLFKQCDDGNVIPIEVGIKIIKDKPLNYPKFIIPKLDLFELDNFYNIESIIDDRNDNIVKIFSRFPDICNVSSKLIISHNPKKQLGKCYKNIDVCVLNEDVVYDDIEKCKNFIIVNVELHQRDEIVSVLYIIDKFNKTITIYDNEGVLYTRDNIIPIVEYAKFLAYSFDLTYKSVSNSCSGTTVKNVDKIFKKLYKTNGRKYPEIHLENYCFLAIIIFNLFRFSNPNVERDTVNKLSHIWFKENPDKAMEMVKELIIILCLT